MKEEDLAEVSDYATERTYQKRETIFSEGDPADWFYIVADGKVKITKLSQEGKEIILEIIAPKNFFGAVAVLRGFPYPANAVAMEESVVARIARRDLLRMLDRFPQVMMEMAGSLGERIKDFHETTKNIALEKVGARIGALLLKLGEQVGTEGPDGVVLDLKLTKQDIAEMVGTTVETAIRTMSRFRKQGLIAEEGGKIVIKNPAGLGPQDI
jgi:CRP/FNR family transcriptional regulator